MQQRHSLSENDVKKENDTDGPSSEQVSQQGDAYSKNREAIKHFFETEQLRHLVAEFLYVQKSFHGKMDKLVQGFKGVYSDLKQPQQEQLEALLKPYGVMIANPFNDKSSGDLQADLLHIFSIINERDKHFMKLLEALFKASANMQDFHELLKDLRQDIEIKKRLMQEVGNGAWLNVEGSVDLPFQNMMRYQLLLNTIAKELHKAGCPPTVTLMKTLMDTISFYDPRLQYVNKYKDALIELMQVEYFVVAASRMSIFSGKPAQVIKTIEDQPDIVTSFEDAFEAIRAYIAGAKSHLAKGAFDPENIFAGLKEMLLHLREAVEPIVKEERDKCYKNETYKDTAYRYLRVSTATLFGPGVVFDEPDKDVLERLNEVIEIVEGQRKIAQKNSVTLDFLQAMTRAMSDEDSVVKSEEQLRITP